jgi:dTDP-4-dehydrorhamnose 3,5-epimerase
MEVIALDIPDVKLVRSKRFADGRGYFVEIWNRRRFAEAGIDVDFVQDNASYSMAAGTVRGLHYQRPPAAQAKLVRVMRGAIFDVVVDLRSAAPSFGRHIAVTLDAGSGDALFVPAGFAHGLCTLEPSTEVAYKVSAFHSPAHDSGILWNDPALGIAWPLGGREPILSSRDMALPRLAEIASDF